MSSRRKKFTIAKIDIKLKPSNQFTEVYQIIRRRKATNSSICVEIIAKTLLLDSHFPVDEISRHSFHVINPSLISLKLPNARECAASLGKGGFSAAAILRWLSFSMCGGKIDVSLSGKSIKVIELLMWSGNDFLPFPVAFSLDAFLLFVRANFYFIFSFLVSVNLSSLKGFPLDTHSSATKSISGISGNVIMSCLLRSFADAAVCEFLH